MQQPAFGQSWLQNGARRSKAWPTCRSSLRRLGAKRGAEPKSSALLPNATIGRATWSRLRQRLWGCRSARPNILLRRCREAGGELTALAPGRSSGGRNRPRTAPASEAALRRVVQEVYLTPQKPTAAEVAREVAGRCRAEKLRVPSSSTMRRRLRSLPSADRRRRGEDHPEAKPVHGHAPAIRFPLDSVQVDHTPIDLILVDPLDREPIGRP